MELIEHVRRCTTHDLALYRPFLVAGRPVGWVLHELAPHLAECGGVFEVRDDAIALSAALATPRDRSAAFAEAAGRLAELGRLRPPRGEAFPVKTSWHAPTLMTIDRGHATAFGILSFGLHVNGIVRTPDGPELWIGTRAADRGIEPGKLDNLIGGGQPAGLTLARNLVKEAAEEAGLTAAEALRARPVGMVTYAMGRDAEGVSRGIKRDVLFLYDLDLPPDFVPRNQDGEVARFDRMDLPAVLARLRAGFDFKFNVALVVIDFLIRHGAIGPDDPEYSALCHGLRTLDLD